MMEERDQNELMSNSNPLLLHFCWLVLPSENCSACSFPAAHLPSQSISCTNNSSWPNPTHRAGANICPWPPLKSRVFFVSTETLSPSTCSKTPIIRISPFHGLALIWRRVVRNDESADNSTSHEMEIWEGGKVSSLPQKRRKCWSDEGRIVCG